MTDMTDLEIVRAAAALGRKRRAATRSHNKRVLEEAGKQLAHEIMDHWHRTRSEEAHKSGNIVYADFTGHSVG